MNHQSLFSSGVELADLLLNSGLLISSWDAIADTQLHYHHPNNNNDPSDLPCVVNFKLHHSPNVTIIAFVATINNNLQAQGTELVSSQELKDYSFNLFDFVATKVNPIFSIHRAAVNIFISLLNELTHLRNQLQNAISSPLIITGHSLGGSIASLFTLWLLDSVLPTTSKRPLCITFGSPLLGDKFFQRAISERPTWNSCFLHVVSNKDLVPRLFIQHNDEGSSSQTCGYNPFGTFLLCSESGCACFEEPESIFELLIATGTSFVGDPNDQQNIQITDYSPVLEGLMRNSLCRRVSVVDNLMTNLQAGITVQLIAIGVGMQGHSGDLSSLTTTTTEREKKLQFSKRNVFNPNKKLTERKIDMTYLEWYKKSSTDQGGYYDSYKNKPPSRTNNREQIKTKQEIIKRHRILTQYWKRMVSEADKMPQKEGANFRTRWLYGGTNYRRLVEPLDIADYYKKGGKDYTASGRSHHYVLLEKWFNDAKPVVIEGGVNERNKACSLTEDSCFWARVEEAVISCNVMKDVRSSEETKRLSRDGLIAFERYVMDLIDKFSVSSEIFLVGSSFMQWWEEYGVVVGNYSDRSRLADFMRGEYKNYV